MRSTLSGPAIAFAAMLAVLYACAPGYRGQTVPVAVVAWPKPIKPDCEIPGVPDAPELTVYQRPDGSALERMYVNQTEVAKIVQWQKDLKQWADQVDRCMEKLADRSGNE